ncbi:MAG: hypothetical protein JKY86_15500 [Gammaproteobacteria bacterium]|nr:hypothetical protein [Gammaproteobacteria bacterium]
MKVKFKHYVASSDRSLAKIAESLGMSQQRCNNWMSRNSLVYVEIQPDRFEDIISVDKAVNYYKRDEK